MSVLAVMKSAGRSAIALAFLLVTPSAWAQGADINITLSPDFDYSSICQPRPTVELVTDWSTWDGKTPPLVADDMFSDALIYLNGSNQVIRDRPLAVQMLQYLADSDWVNRSAALYHLGRTYLDIASGYYDTTQAIAFFEEAIELGHVGAAAYLGRVYQLGRLLPSDPDAAEKYLKLAAQNNDTSALFNLVKLYYREPHLAAAPSDAENYLKAGLTAIYVAIAEGRCVELNTIGNLFSDNDLNVENHEKAVAWYNAALKTGDVEAAVQLSNAYALGQGVEYNLAKAIELMRIGAESGRVSSMVALAKLELSVPSPENRADAKRWLEKAAQHQELGAFLLLADLAEGDFGDIPDANAAFNHYAQAASLPNVTSETLIELGRRYATGDGTPVDQAKAFGAYGRAADLGAGDAFVAQYNLIRQNPGLTSANPLSLLRSAANRGQADAMALMSDAYQCGIGGVQSSLKIAERWRERAAASGEPTSLMAIANASAKRGDMEVYFRNVRRIAVDGDGEAMVLLAQAYRLGLGTPADAAQAQRWLNMALQDPLKRSDALLARARIAMFGTYGEPVDIESAYQDLLQADALGNNSATYDLARLELEGFPGHPANRPKGIALYVSAAQKGHQAAMTRLAELEVNREEGGGLDWTEWLGKASAGGNIRAVLMQAETVAAAERSRFYDAALALEPCDAKDLIAIAAAVADDPDYSDEEAKLVQDAIRLEPQDAGTLYQLAQLVRNGALGEQEKGRSTEFFIRAAQAGKVEAMREVGRMYTYGRNVEADIDQGRDWLVRAATLGDPDAAEELATLVETHGAEDSGIMEIVDGLSQAADGGNRSATIALANILSGVSMSDRHFGELAMTWLLRASEQGDAASMMQVANAYALGVAVPRSEAESARWLKAAAEAGLTEAFGRYAVVLQLGLGVPADPVGAKFWLDKAAAQEGVSN
jgi:uncharacterized protein